MENAVKVMQTKLNNSKAFIDNESFVFLFKNAKPFAIHKDQLFKNQLYDESIDSYGHKKYTRKTSSTVTNEKIKKIDGDLNEYFAILYDSGKVIFPSTIKDGSYTLNYIKALPQNITTNINGKDIEIEDKIKDITIGRYGNSDWLAIGTTLYALTNNNKIYKRGLRDGAKVGFDVGGEIDRGEIVVDNTQYITLNNEVIWTDTNETAKSIFAGSYYYIGELLNDGDSNKERFLYGLYILTVENKLYFIPNNDTEYYFEGLYRIEIEGNFKYLTNIRSAYNRTYFIFKNGIVKAFGDNTVGTLGTGSTSSVITELTDVCSLIENADDETTKIINAMHINDVAIGKYHTIFLLDDGTAIGFGDNYFGQLGSDDGKTYDSTFLRMSYNSYILSEVKCTSYGTIFRSSVGKLIFTGTFVHGELGIFTDNEKVYALNADGTVDYSTLLKDQVSITIDSTNYTKFLQVFTLTKIARTYEFVGSTSKLVPSFFVKLPNITGDGVFAFKDDLLCYYTGINTLLPIGNKYGSSENDITNWEPLESESNDLLRYFEERVKYWSYYYDFICKLDNNNGGLYATYYKTSNGVWINWDAFISKYMNITLKINGETLSKVEIVYDENGDKIDSHLNWDSFAKYIASNSTVEKEFEIDKKNIPALNYIDANLLVSNINKADNISCKLYTQDDCDADNETLNEKISYYTEQLSTFKAALAETDDTDKILEYSDTIETLNNNIETLNEKIASNKSKVNTIVSSEYFDFADVKPFNPLKVVGTEDKQIKYTHTIFEEDEDGNAVVKTTTSDGVTTVDQESVTKSIKSNITKMQFDFVNLDHIKNPTVNTNNSVNIRDDVQLSINDDVNDDESYTFDNFLVWMSGYFVNKDYVASDDKSICIKNGKSLLDVRTICEYPGLGEPKYNPESLPTLNVDTATVDEQNYTTEVRWDVNLRTFAWKGVKIDGPYKIHNGKIESELTGFENFYYGDVFIQLFTKIRIFNMKLEKDTFILFMDGTIIPDDEYDVTYDSESNISYIVLHTFKDYIQISLQENVNINDPGYEGHVRTFINGFADAKQFSIAFLSTDEKYKKVKLYYDRQTIRNYPKPGQVMFRDVSYNDLIIVDGYYIPYLWESKYCIRFPETLNTVRKPTDDFISESDIYRIRPYITYKKENELTDYECRQYAYETSLINNAEYESLSDDSIRALVKEDINKRIKDC